MPQRPLADGDRPTLLLVHGAWHGAWCWEDVVPILADRDWRVRTVDLPSSLDMAEPPPSPVPDLYADAGAIADVLDDIAGPAVVVAHSYGGAPVTEATAGAANVAHLVYLAAFQLDVGESVGTSMGADPAAPIPRDGYSPPMHAADLYSDVPVEIAARAARRLRLQSDPSRAQPIRRAGWHTIESTYLVCDHDAALSPRRRELFAARARTVHHLPTGHSPFYSAPDDLVDLLTAIASDVTVGNR